MLRNRSRNKLVCMAVMNELRFRFIPSFSGLFVHTTESRCMRGIVTFYRYYLKRAARLIGRTVDTLRQPNYAAVEIRRMPPQGLNFQQPQCYNRRQTLQVQVLYSPRAERGEDGGGKGKKKRTCSRRHAPCSQTGPLETTPR